MSAIRPTKEQITELLNAPDEGPVVMVNLLKFKKGGGSSEYGKYGDSVSKMVEKTGGKILWMGRADQTLIGPSDETWDAIALVEYPSRKAFIEMTSTKEYDQAHEHREGGLEDTRLIACTTRHGAL
jgi:uncharacterized protein (DUF1330 family)